MSANALLSISDLEGLLKGRFQLSIDDSDATRIDAAVAYLRSKVSDSNPVYGVNTGFGSLHSTRIKGDDLGALQVNLIRSHACGAGRKVRPEVIRLMLALKAQNMRYGNSGAQRATVQRLLDHLKADVLPVIYEQGSLGASGDLAPLAHLSLPLLGEGMVYYKGEVREAADVMAQIGWQPLNLGMKEGLALLNGTQFMSAHGVYALIHAQRLLWFADLIGAMSLDAIGGLLEPFDALVHQVRPHPGQIACAARVRHFLKDSPLMAQPKHHVQDPYSFRCMPQVHGATADAITYAKQVVECEINSVSDNPLIFPDEDRIISAGNFHGQPLAITFDFLAIALAELANISERRTFQLVSGRNGLPDYLVNSPGLNSGFMIPQYTAAGIVSQNKQLCTPASVDSIVSSNGQEDHVSMGANAATKLLQVVDNVYQVLAIELFTAAQALDFRRPLASSPVIGQWMGRFRELVPFLTADVQMQPHMQAAKRFLMETDLE
ncbi:MAG: histidine ammonia-lyase [Flavobacteriales bacterium]|nr:histidine ammonia-lyase [Flavobacteriales bacterium]